MSDRNELSPIDELLPLAEYHAHSDELLDRSTRMGGIAFAGMTSVATFIWGFQLIAAPAIVGAVLGGVAAYGMWAVLWGGTMKKLHRWRITKVYEEEAGISPPTPEGAYSHRLPMCVDISSGAKPVAGTLFMASDRCTFVPNTDQRRAKPVTIPLTEAHIEVSDWDDAPRIARGTAHPYRQIDVTYPGGTHSFLSLRADAVVEEVRHLLGSGERPRLAAESDADQLESTT